MKTKRKGNETMLLERQREVEASLQRNVDHPFLKAVHFLVNQQLAEKRLNNSHLHNKHKLVAHRLKAMARYVQRFA